MGAQQRMKYISLTVLVAQITAHVLTMRYSLTVKTKGPRYLASTAVLIVEFIKLLLCVLVIFVEQNFSGSNLCKLLNKEVWSNKWETSKLSVPAFLYTLQNIILYWALARLDAATYQVTYQLKILTTALFAVLMLGKRLDATKWLSLCILTIGVALVQWPTESNLSKKNDKAAHISSEFVGIGFVFIACILSGFSGIYFEKLLKSSEQSLWIRNFQLAIFGILIGAWSVYFLDAEKIIQNGFFQGYNKVTWIVILLQAFGGLIIASVVKYADNILKGFATSVSIILQLTISYYWLGDFKPTSIFFIGTTLVIGATFLYGYERKMVTL